MPPSVGGALKPSAQRVEDALAERGLPGRVVELAASTRTAADAARAVGCEVGQIAKSLVFRGSDGRSAVLVITSGTNRVDEEWMARFAGGPLLRADPEFVRAETGFVIGGIPALGHSRTLKTFIDRDLLLFPTIWAAAGHPNAVCRLTPAELLDLSPGRVVPVAPEGPSSDAHLPPAWVTLDCYGTLVDWRAGLLGSLAPILGTPPSETKDRFFRTYLAEERRVETGPYRPYREVMAEALLAAAEITGIALPRSAAQEVPESIPEWPLFPDTSTSLREIVAGGSRLAVLSNIDRDLLDRTLARHDLPVSISVTAEDVRSYKPAPAHWIRWWKRSGADPGRTWHVAASYEHDIRTAARLGFRTVYVRRYADLFPRVEAGTVVRGLGELLGRLSGERAGDDRVPKRQGSSGSERSPAVEGRPLQFSEDFNPRPEWCRR